MDKSLRKVVETRTNDNLVAKSFELDVFSVTLKQTATATELAKGTVLALSASDDKYVILGTEGALNEVLTANAILAEDVTTSTTGDIVATAYRKGHFNKNALIVKDGYTLTNSDREKLRNAGIYLEAEI